MKKFMICFLFLHGFMYAQELTPEEKSLIAGKIKTFVSAINNNNYQEIASLVAPDNPALVSAIQGKMESVISYTLSYNIPKDFFEEKKVKIVGRYKEKGASHKASGFSTYFIFENKEDGWFIVDTDFAKPFSLFKFPFFAWLLFLMPFFWVWMLIDCVTHSVKNKAMWIILLIILNVIAAIIYFFVVKCRRKQEKVS